MGGRLKAQVRTSLVLPLLLKYDSHHGVVSCETITNISAECYWSSSGGKSDDQSCDVRLFLREINETGMKSRTEGSMYLLATVQLTIMMLKGTFMPFSA